MVRIPGVRSEDPMDHEAVLGPTLRVVGWLLGEILEPDQALVRVLMNIPLLSRVRRRLGVPSSVDAPDLAQYRIAEGIEPYVHAGSETLIECHMVLAKPHGHDRHVVAQQRCRLDVCIEPG